MLGPWSSGITDITWCASPLSSHSPEGQCHRKLAVAFVQRERRSEQQTNNKQKHLPSFPVQIKIIKKKDKILPNSTVLVLTDVQIVDFTGLHKHKILFKLHISPTLVRCGWTSGEEDCGQPLLSSLWPILGQKSGGSNQSAGPTCYQSLTPHSQSQ